MAKCQIAALTGECSPSIYAFLLGGGVTVNSVNLS